MRLLGRITPQGWRLARTQAPLISCRGVTALADAARAAAATEAEITEAVEVGYLYGGTAALVMGVNAFTSVALRHGNVSPDSGR